MKSTSSARTRNVEKIPSDEEAFEAWKLLERYRAKIIAANGSEPDALIRIVDAAQIAATSARIVREAIRAGDLPAFGRQRDRAVRRSDLDGWIESRRSKPIAGVVDADILRRMDRLSRGKKRSAA